MITYGIHYGAALSLLVLAPAPAPDALDSTVNTPRPPAQRRRPSRVALATLGVVAGLSSLGVVLSSGAFFTSEASIPDVRAGLSTLEISAETAESSTPIDVEDLLPGDVRRTQVSISNTGRSAVYYSIAPDDLTGDPALAAALELALDVEGTDPETALSVAEAATAERTVAAALEPGEETILDVTLSLPLGAGEALQGTVVTFDLVVTATQTRHVTPPTDGWILP